MGFSVGGFFKRVFSAAKKIIPVAIGYTVGGPAGAAIGGALGSAARGGNIGQIIQGAGAGYGAGSLLGAGSAALGASGANLAKGAAGPVTSFGGALQVGSNALLSGGSNIFKAAQGLSGLSNIAGGLFGLIDDYLVCRESGTYMGGGLSLRIRLAFVLFLASLGAWWFYVKLGMDSIHIPFIGDANLGLWFIPLFIIFMITVHIFTNLTQYVRLINQLIWILIIIQLFFNITYHATRLYIHNLFTVFIINPIDNTFFLNPIGR